MLSFLLGFVIGIISLIFGSPIYASLFPYIDVAHNLNTSRYVNDINYIHYVLIGTCWGTVFSYILVC